ncbi:hypothetical protein BRD01_03685 [Halobacteriales archaeon QS_8_65_32]|nr:MAG: hypothetical protein BRD01_03685 [Halobacteriales archaeon QS_8_65_32]
MLDFAERYDPQPIHVGLDMAATPYEGIIASEWHTASACIALLVEGFSQRYCDARLVRPRRTPVANVRETERHKRRDGIFGKVPPGALTTAPTSER